MPPLFLASSVPSLILLNRSIFKISQAPSYAGNGVRITWHFQYNLPDHHLLQVFVEALRESGISCKMFMQPIIAYSPDTRESLVSVLNKIQGNLSVRHTFAGVELRNYWDPRVDGSKFSSSWAPAYFLSIPQRYFLIGSRVPCLHSYVQLLQPSASPAYFPIHWILIRRKQPDSFLRGANVEMQSSPSRERAFASAASLIYPTQFCTLLAHSVSRTHKRR
ncbi:hypothetical protein B0H19DRAFT_1068931 [Mycena capillaripes]|nr:hypothetical protein B0H19DRAFT_1068931 [Mycena capillaripes]